MLLSFVARKIHSLHVLWDGERISLKKGFPLNLAESKRLVEPGTHHSACRMSKGNPEAGWPEHRINAMNKP